MANRLDALAILNDLKPTLTETAKSKAVKALYTIIADFTHGTKLADIQALSKRERHTILECLAEGTTLAQLTKISKAWDPKRPVEKGISFTQLWNEVGELADARRQPFEVPKMTYVDAQRMSMADQEHLADSINRFANATQLKSLLKKWDKLGPDPKGMSVDKVRVRLMALLRQEIEPTAAPPKPAKARAKSSTSSKASTRKTPTSKASGGSSSAVKTQSKGRSKHAK